MHDSSAKLKAELELSQPVVADSENHFPAFGPGWGFSAYAVPAGVAVVRLGAKDLAASQLLLACQLNRQRITAAIAEGGVRDPSRRVILSKI